MCHRQSALRLEPIVPAGACLQINPPGGPASRTISVIEMSYHRACLRTDSIGMWGGAQASSSSGVIRAAATRDSFRGPTAPSQRRTARNERGAAATAVDWGTCEARLPRFEVFASPARRFGSPSRRSSAAPPQSRGCSAVWWCPTRTRPTWSRSTTQPASACALRRRRRNAWPAAMRPPTTPSAG